jgi:hypothetical protein
MNFVDAMTAAQAGFDSWAAKPHNAKWFKRIDGTPIPNDLLVNVSEAFLAALKAEPVAEVAQLGARSEHDLHNVLKSVLYHFGPEGAAKVTKDALDARPLATPQPLSDTEESGQ